MKKLMKKVMILATVLMTGTMVQAASVNWTLSPFALSDPDGGYLTGGALYFLQGDSSGAAAAIIGGTFLADFGSQILDNSVTAPAGNMTSRVVNGVTAGTYDFFVVAFDAGTIGAAQNFIISSDINQSTYEPPATATTATFSSSSFAGGTAEDWSPIPEPTSVALLAIGVAAIGLRRKFRK